MVASRLGSKPSEDRSLDAEPETVVSFDEDSPETVASSVPEDTDEESSELEALTDGVAR